PPRRARGRRACARSARPAGSRLAHEHDGVARHDERAVEGGQAAGELAVDRAGGDVPVGRLAVGEGHRAADVPALHDREVAEERPFRVLRAEAVSRCSGAADELPELGEVPLAAGRGDEPSVRPQDAAELAERLLEVTDVVQHPGGDRAVEDPAPERQVLGVADDRLDAAPAGELDHPLGLVEGDDPGVELPADPLGQLAVPAADLEYEVGLRLGDRLERDRVGIGPGRRGLLGGRPRREAALVGGLARDEARVVERAHASTIAWPGSRLPGALPPSQAFTVAPTSANSPSWMRPFAFLPWA